MSLGDMGALTALYAIHVTFFAVSNLTVASNFEGYLTKFAPHKALKLIACCKLTFDERVVAHRVDRVYGGFDCPLYLHSRHLLCGQQP